MKKIDVTVIGELNVDLILNEIDSFPIVGKEMLAQTMNLTLGSSSAIFANNLSSLGTKVAFIGKIGKDPFGELVLQSLAGSGVDTKGIIQDTKAKTGATIVLNYGEDRAMVTHAGAMETLQFSDIELNRLTDSDHLHISSYFLQKSLQKDIGKLFRLAKEAGMTTSFDPQWDPAEKWEMALEKVLPFVDIFLPNEKELLLLTKEATLPDAISAIKAISHTIVVKRGTAGSVLFTKSTMHAQPAFLHAKVIDAIGAGDSFNAGFIHKFILDQSIETCQKFGNLIGAISTTAAGGTSAFQQKQDILKNAKETFGYAE
jgi:sugar/nucleoside kinase (ribokinase family)